MCTRTAHVPCGHMGEHVCVRVCVWCHLRRLQQSFFFPFRLPPQATLVAGRGTHNVPRTGCRAHDRLLLLCIGRTGTLCPLPVRVHRGQLIGQMDPATLRPTLVLCAALRRQTCQD